MGSPDIEVKEIEKIIVLLKTGKVGVIPTDTIYGIVGSALNPHTVEEIYILRKRATNKPMIILISSLEDFKKFSINLTKAQTDFLKKIWPNPVSVVLPCTLAKFTYLHRGKRSLAFRMPRNDELLQILKKTGPLVAPSANIEGEKVAESINQAKKYFGNTIDFYVDGGKLKSRPSTIVQLFKDGTHIVLREGVYRV
ncbi:threonylcarbamoyl-AMP synthase [Candidatus Daviesbacteria bacterium]|nr:threonylcarbamoyl-AMP synthase [Candidatus Daviesbacteria bacterium]